jgi:hypothetical protein
MGKIKAALELAMKEIELKAEKILQLQNLRM